MTFEYKLKYTHALNPLDEHADFFKWLVGYFIKI